MTEPQVGVVMGSDSDWDTMKKAAQMLRDLGVACEVDVVSAHRSPERAHEYAVTAEERGIKAIIAGAGGAAHLAGVIAALTPLPVIGVPMRTSGLGGQDSLYSIVQMPSGVPVATMAIGDAGAKNAAIFAAQILAVHDDGLRTRLKAYKKAMAAQVADKAEKVKRDFSRLDEES